MSTFRDGKLVIYNHEDILQYCIEQNIQVEDFNFPVIIDPDKGYNKDYFKVYGLHGRAVIPISDDENIFDPEFSCKDLFCYCSSFNQPVEIPFGVKDCTGMFRECTAFNHPIIIPVSVTETLCMFYHCRSFNQSIIIPENVNFPALMFSGCDSLNQVCTILGNPDVTHDAMVILKNRFDPFSSARSYIPLFNIEGFIKSIFGKYMDVDFSESFTIRRYDELMQYTFDHDKIEMRARLLQFRQDHRDQFPDPLRLE